MSGRDIYRDTYIRYLGYANEVGEAFRPLVHRSFVTASYAIATAYVCADAYDKSSKVYNNGGSNKKVVITAGDVFIWQMLASVIIPGFTINRVTWLTGRLVHSLKAPKGIKNALPTVVGLCSIPIIIHPIDNLVTYIMDNTYRKWIK